MSHHVNTAVPGTVFITGSAKGMRVIAELVRRAGCYAWPAPQFRL